MKTPTRLALCALAAAGFWTACGRTADSPGPAADADVPAFLTRANDELLRLSNAANQAGWVAATYITPDTEAISARASDAYVTASTNFAKEAARYGEAGTAGEQRQLTVMKNVLTMAAPSDPKEGTELTQLVASMESAYGRGKYCPPAEVTDDACLDVEEITEIMAKDRDPRRLREVWEGWRTIAPPLKQDYARFVELSNKGAKELGFADTGVMWRSRYDMPPDDFARELERCPTPLHRCSIYGSAEAGTRLMSTMALGASKPWPEALEALTGQREMDATAIVDYFAPLKTWLDEQNAGHASAW